jgi:hypothetical protein
MKNLVHKVPPLVLKAKSLLFKILPKFYTRWRLWMGQFWKFGSCARFQCCTKPSSHNNLILDPYLTHYHHQVQNSNVCKDIINKYIKTFQSNVFKDTHTMRTTFLKVILVVYFWHFLHNPPFGRCCVSQLNPYTFNHLPKTFSCILKFKSVDHQKNTNLCWISFCWKSIPIGTSNSHHKYDFHDICN